MALEQGDQLPLLKVEAAGPVTPQVEVVRELLHASVLLRNEESRGSPHIYRECVRSYRNVGID